MTDKHPTHRSPEPNVLCLQVRSHQQTDPSIPLRVTAETADGLVLNGIKRIATAAPYADEILVFHHGRIRERGTHRALLGAGGLYEKLYQLQLGAQIAAAS